MYSWFVPDGFWHTKSNGIFPSHEALCVLNTHNEAIEVLITLYFEDSAPLRGFKVSVGAERTLHIRMDRILNQDGVPVPQNIPYAMMVECQKTISLQYTRVDTSQPEMSIATTII